MLTSSNHILTNKPEMSIARHSFFESSLFKMKELSETIRYPKGQLLFNEGNTSRGLYIISSGKVKLTKQGSDGKEQIIKIIQEGEFAGYKGMLTNERCSVSAVVLTELEVLFLAKEHFIKFFKEDYLVTNYFTRLLCNDVVEMEEKVVSMAYKPVRGRLAETLIKLNNTYKNSFIDLSRAELANIIGTAKETVIRLLSEFKNESLIETNGKWILVKDTNGILRINNLYN